MFLFTSRHHCSLNPNLLITDMGDELLVTELMFNGTFKDLDYHQIVALVSCFIPGDRSNEQIRLKGELAKPLQELQDTARKIAEIQRECKLDINVDEYVESTVRSFLMDVIYSWSKNYIGADNHLQMHGSTSEKSTQSKGQSSNADSVQGKSANCKSTTPSSINVMTEQKCEILDWRRNLVGTGRVRRDPNQISCHGMPINKEEEVVVIVDIIHNGEAELYAPGSFADILSDVGISGSMKWHVSGIRYV